MIRQRRWRAVAQHKFGKTESDFARRASERTNLIDPRLNRRRRRHRLRHGVPRVRKAPRHVPPPTVNQSSSSPQNLSGLSLGLAAAAAAGLGFRRRGERGGEIREEGIRFGRWRGSGRIYSRRRGPYGETDSDSRTRFPILAGTGGRCGAHLSVGGRRGPHLSVGGGVRMVRSGATWRPYCGFGGGKYLALSLERQGPLVGEKENLTRGPEILLALC